MHTRRPTAQLPSPDYGTASNDQATTTSTVDRAPFSVRNGVPGRGHRWLWDIRAAAGRRALLLSGRNLNSARGWAWAASACQMDASFCVSVRALVVALEE